jgi:hypothetical protein
VGCGYRWSKEGKTGNISNIRTGWQSDFSEDRAKSLKKDKGPRLESALGFLACRHSWFFSQKANA